MGLGSRIAITGGAIIGAILLLAYVGNKTDILGRFTRGLTSIGGAIGQGVGGGLVAIPQGVGKAFGLGLAGTDPITAEVYDPLGLKKAYSDFLKSLGITDPFQAFNDPTNNPLPTADAYSPNVFDSSVITPSLRVYSDIATSSKSVRTGFQKIASLNRALAAASGGKAKSISAGAGAGRTRSSIATSQKGKAAQARARARAAARKKGKSCFNENLITGGVEKIDYRYPYM